MTVTSPTVGRLARRTAPRSPSAAPPRDSRWRGHRRRGLPRRRGHLPARHRHDLVELHRRPHGVGRLLDQGPSDRRQREPQHAGSASPSTVACPCSLFGNAGARDPVGRPTARRSSSASTSRPTPTASSPAIRFYKGVGQHRHAHRHPVERPPGRPWPRAPSPTRPPPAGRRCTLRQRRRRSPPGRRYVASYFAPAGHYAGRLRTSSASRLPRRTAHGPGPSVRRRQRRLPQRARRSRRAVLRRHELLRRRPLQQGRHHAAVGDVPDAASRTRPRSRPPSQVDGDVRGHHRPVDP